MSARPPVLDQLRAEEESYLRKLDECRGDIARLMGETGEGAAVPARDWMSEPLGDFQWILRGLIARETVTVLAAEAAVGKSTLIVQLTTAISSGTSFLGYATGDPTSTLTVAAEGSRLAFRNRFSTACRTLRLNPDTLSWFIQPKKATEYHFGSAGLNRLIESCKPTLVVCDTVGYFHRGDENDANDWKRHVMVPIRQAITKYGCSFLLVHHHSKSSTAEGWQKGRGSTAMFGDADHWLRLEKPQGAPADHRDLYVDKNKYGEANFSLPLIFRSQEAVFERR